MNRVFKIDFKKYLISGVKPVRRFLSDMRGYFYDEGAYERILSREDPLIYEFYEAKPEESLGNLSIGLTNIMPGRVGKEFYMTKGHFHVRDLGEIYIGLRGRGVILLQTRSLEFRHLWLEPGVIVHVPPGWGHRTVNVGDDILSFLYSYSADAGHDYDIIKERGFMKLVVFEDGEIKFIDNPKYFR